MGNQEIKTDFTGTPLSDISDARRINARSNTLKSLLEPKKKNIRRNNDGRITIRRRVGGHSGIID